MKKLFSLVFALVLVLGTLCISVSATTDTAATVNAYVTIADADGKLALAAEKITVGDANKNGVIDIDDALYTAHEKKYPQGVEAGYSSSVGAYGLAIDKLWGAENGSGYGYYVNNASAMSLADVISEGAYITAFVYTDTVAYSDTYCFFDVKTAVAQTGDTLALTLSAASYDASWNPITVPVANATITIDGEATSYKTDAEGKVTVTLDKSGTLVISATSETQTLVPPVCTVTVGEKSSVSTDSGSGDDINTQVGTQSSSVNSSEGGCKGVVGVSAVAVAAVVGAAALTFRKKDEE